MEGDGFTSVGDSKKKGGQQQQPKKEFITPLPSVVDQQKKKKKGAAAGFMYGAAAAGGDDENAKEEQEQTAPVQTAASKMLAAFAATGDSDDEKAKKGKKHQHNKKDRQGKKGKGNKKGAADSEEEGGEAAAVEKDEEEKGEEVEAAVTVTKQKADGMPIDVIYCRVCGVPPEYCMFDKKDSSECKAWVLKEHPELHDKIYGPVTPAAEGEEVKEGEQPVQQQQKKKKKVSLAPSGNADVKVYKTKRGGRKVISTVVGLQHYGVPLKDIAKVMGKKFACGSAYAPDDEKYGECIQVQGDISERFVDFVEGELAKYKIPVDRVKFEEVKKKKKAEGAGEAGGDDDGDEQ